MRGTADLAPLDHPLPALLREVTGVDPEPPGSHVILESAGIRSTQRLALGETADAVVAFTWPAELLPQARYLYDGDRAPRLLAAARSGGWHVEARPHLAFRNSRAGERLYTTPLIAVDEYVARWAGPDGRQIGQHDRSTIASDLWPWLLDRGYAASTDEPGLSPFLARAGRRPTYLRAGLRLRRSWPADRPQGPSGMAAEIRAAFDVLLAAVGDPPLPRSRPEP